MAGLTVPCGLAEAGLAPGDVVFFGSYEQDNDLSNGPEPIEWIVLACDGDKTLLLSKYGLDAQPYNEEDESVTWETCTLRTWLNEEFLNAAFTEAERAAILPTDVDNSAAQGFAEWNTDGGNDTQDKVFLLSCAEADEYFGAVHVDADDGSNTGSRAAPTAYARDRGAPSKDDCLTADGESAGWWWLRSPGSQQSGAARINYDGSLLSAFVNGRGGVRPAIRVNPAG